MKRLKLDRANRRKEAAIIVAKLREAGMSVEEIAYRAKMSWRAVDRWSRGVAAPSATRLTELRRLAVRHAA